mgnify:CR=1 FL=1
MEVRTILWCSYRKDTIAMLLAFFAVERYNDAIKLFVVSVHRTLWLLEIPLEVIMEKEILKELPACPVETTLTLISDKWKVLILRDLMSGTKRFGELKKSIGHVTQKVLTAQLRQMEESGLLTRKVYAEVPPRVEYTLTELGYSLKPVLDAMWAWGEGYKSKLEGKAE